MAKHHYAVVLFVALLIVATLTISLSAQDEVVQDFPLPACTTAEVLDALELIHESNVIDDLEDSLDAMNGDMEYLVTGYAELMLIRNTYYLDVQPHLEDCRAIWKFDLAFGNHLTNKIVDIGNLIIVILTEDMDTLALAEPMDHTILSRWFRSRMAFITLRLMGGEDVSDD